MTGSVRNGFGCGTTVLLAGLAMLIAADRIHWRRSDGGKADPAAVAAALSDCSALPGTGRERERLFAICMSKRGYFTWDGV